MAARSRARSAGGDGQSLRKVLEGFVGTFLRRLSAVESVVSRLQREAQAGGSAAKRSSAKRSTAKRSTAKRATTAAKRGTAKRATTAGTRGTAKRATAAKRRSATKPATAKRSPAAKRSTASKPAAKRATAPRRTAPAAGTAARPAASRSRVGSRASLPDRSIAAPVPLGEDDLSQRREQLLSELGPPRSPFPDLGPGPVAAGDGDDDELASEELSVAVSQPEAPGPLP